MEKLAIYLSGVNKLKLTRFDFKIFCFQKIGFFSDPLKNFCQKNGRKINIVVKFLRIVLRKFIFSDPLKKLCQKLVEKSI